MKTNLIALGAMTVALALSTVSAQAQCGGASWYSLPGNRTANGEIMNPNAMTAAHKSLPFGSRVRVTDQNSGRSVVVTINDRGPFVRGRIIDLSREAASELGIRNAGHAPVCIEQI
jgi:rare lipoprotein A